MILPLLQSRPINPPGIALLVIFLVSPINLAAPLNQADASPILGNTKADLYEPVTSRENRKFATMLQW